MSMLRKWTTRQFILVAILALLVVGIFLRTSQFLRAIGIKSRPISSPQSQPKTIYTLALLGYGGGQHEGAYLTDTVILARIDTVKNQVLLISIPRDLWVKIPTTSKNPFFQKINAIYQMSLFPTDFPDVSKKYTIKNNDALLLKEVLQKVTGLSVDAYVAVDFASFVRTIDLLGGVDITIDKAFIDPSYPLEGKEKDLCEKDDQFKQVEKYLTQPNQSEMDSLFKDKPDLKEFFINITDAPEKAFPCRYETLTFAAGATHFTGSEALKFVRSRHSLQDGTDFSRATRQQKVILAVKSKVLSIGFIPRIMPLLKELEGRVITDLSYDLIGKLVTELKDAAQYKISKLVLSDQNYLVADYSASGQYILRPKSGDQQWSQIHTVIHSSIEGIKLTPTPYPQISKPTTSVKK